jgi:TolA-binding protein
VSRAVLLLALLPGLAFAAPRPGDKPAETPAEKPLAPELEALVKAKEGEVATMRREAIKLLQDFLADSPPSDETAEGLFKLAELTWEEAQADYLRRMGAYQSALAACHDDRARCPQVPRRQPRLDLTQAQSTYERLIREYPKFRKIDTVIYLYAFSLRDQGRLDEGVVYFKRLLRDYPHSRFRADAWMAVAEFRFYEQQDYAGALHAYEQVRKFPHSSLYGLALFKTAWCHWKLGHTELAAARFKDVLDLGRNSKDRSPDEQKRAAELQDQALDYLVELFTEDDSKTAQDAYDFLAQIGGKPYSLRVMRRLADTVYDQTRYERAAQAYLFVLSLDPKQLDAPELQRRVVESFQALGRGDRAAAEMRRLATLYGPRSEWAKANADHPEAVAQARTVAEGFIRTQAKTLHAQAQRNEKESHVVDKDRYDAAAEAYAFYAQQFPDAKDVTELRYLRADILFFKLHDLRAAGQEYLEVGRSKPVGGYHKEALLQAMNAFEKLRPAAPAKGPLVAGKKRAVTNDDRRFAEAADLYATLFPNDKEIITVIFKNGQFFYDYGDYDEAIKRFGLIIERYPSSPVAGPAGDRLLECLGAAKDYDNIESWGRRLKSTKAFSGKSDQQRLDEVIAGAMMKSGESHAAKEDYQKAAATFERVAKEYPGSALAARALSNAGAAFEKGGRPEGAVAAYKALADRYPKASEAPEALLVAGKIEESIANYASAAALYEQLASRYPQAPQAPQALRNAGLLRQTMGQTDKAVAHYAAYEKQYKGRPETRDIAFQKGMLLLEKKDPRGAAVAFAEFVRSYPDDARVIQAHVREGEAQMKLGADGKAKEALGKALAHYKTHRKDEDAALYAAEARYQQGELIFREYEAIKLAGRPRQLTRALEEKAKLLDEAKKVYLDVVSYRVPEWATAALYRIGQAYASYAKAMRGAKVPRELSKEEQQIYRDELEKTVVVIEDKALDSYRSGYAKALEIGVYNKYTRLLREGLAELASTEFPKDAEARPGLRLGEARPPVWDVIEEIKR